MKRMERTRDAYGKALKQQMKRAGITRDILAEKLNVTPQAVRNWEVGASWPLKKYRPIIERELNLRLVEEEMLSADEAVIVNEQTAEQLRIDFDEGTDETDSKWIHIYATNSSDAYRSAIIHKGNLPDEFRLLLIKQKYADLKDTIPFVAIPVHSATKEEEFK